MKRRGERVNRFSSGAIRYWLLAATLFASMALNTVNGRWSGDFWEHAAVVRELATHPWAPLHPILESDAPHAFFSPYSLAVALIARVLHLAPVTALAVAGMVNLAAFLLVYPWFIRRLFSDVDHGAAAFYSLLLVLMLWGPGAWVWSGFMHVVALGYVLPYPSMFAFVLTLATAASLLAWTKDGRRRWLFLVFPSTVLVVLTHPTTAVILFVVAFWIVVAGGRWSLLKTVGIAGAVLLGTLLVAQLWPYYDLATLLLQSPPDFHSDSRELYTDILPKIAPALAGIPVIAWRLLRNRRDVVGLSFLSLAGIYVAGGLTGLWGFGRVISMLMILLQLAIGWALAAAEKGLAIFDSGRSGVIRATIAAVSLSILLFRVNAMDRISDMVRGGGPAYQNYMFLGRLTGQYEVVVADLLTGWPVPAFGGKVVASLHPLHFMRDHQERRERLGTFFANDTPHSERMVFLTRYGADYILLDRSRQSSPLIETLTTLGEPIYDNGRFLLMKVPGVGEQKR